MSKPVTPETTALLDSLKAGILAAEEVVKNWSKGDLAAAVNRLDDWAQECRVDLGEDAPEEEQHG